MKNLISIIPFLLFIVCCARVKEKPQPQALTSKDSLTPVNLLTPEEIFHYRSAVQGFIDSSLKIGRLNGSIMVAKNGQIIYEQYAGFANPRAKQDSITANTPFHLASVSKTITAVGILKLWQDGKLNINDTVSKYLIGFPCPGVTIKTLLNHRSGLPNYVHYMERLGWDRNKFMSNQDVLDFIIARHDEIDIGPPDRHFVYSNTNYALLALIIEKVSGQFYGDFMKKNFFEPLGMTYSYVFTRADSARSIPSFFRNGRQYAFDYLDYVYGDKNVYSTVRDMVKFEHALSSGVLLRKEILEEAYTPYSFEKPGIHNYGLGWRMFLLKNGKKLIYHNGWWHGYRTAFYRLLDEKVSIIALCNNDSRLVYNTKKLADIFGNYMQTGNKDEELENDTVKNHRYSHHAHRRHLARSSGKKITSRKSLATKK